MEYNILIKKEELMHQVELRTHYHAEGEKRKDLNADIGETSSDDEELLETFLNSAINELIAAVAGRFEGISCNISSGYIEISFIGSDDTRSNIMPILKQAITDYLINELMTQWTLIRYPAWSQTYVAMRNDFFARVKELFAAFCNRKIRRRSTNLAGI
jgi:hypothetical protein